jgi:hypothetical protein
MVDDVKDRIRKSLSGYMPKIPLEHIKVTVQVQRPG